VMATQRIAVEVFCSYVHEDEAWLRKLETHLSPLKRQGLISLWHDRLITAGTDWTRAIDTHLETASVILLLVSADFFASDYCYGVEMKRALSRHEANEARVIPIIVRPVDWKDAPFAHLLALPTDAKPLSNWSKEDTALADVAAGIRRAIVEDILLLQASVPHANFPSIWTVPYRRNPFFTGREDLLTLLRDRLTISKVAALTQTQAISGLGGIGKTQVALEYAYRYREAYRCIFWIKAAIHETLISDFASLADLLHLPEKDEQDQNLKVAAVKRWLATHDEWLLILDNADDLTVVNEFLPTDSRGHILLTTRAQAIGALAQQIIIETMGMIEATLFLLRRAKLLAEDVFLDKVTEEDLAGAEAIAIEMDFFPLALDQAGAYIDETGCSLSAYLNLYRTHRQALLRRRGFLPSDHPEPVATTWSLSFQKVEQVNPSAAELLRLCAFLDPDTIPEDLLSEGGPHLGPVLQRVAANALKLNEAMEELRKFSLIQRNPNTRTMSVHRLVQAVVKDALKKSTQRRWAERAVRVVNAIFPEKVEEPETWLRCRRYLSQVQTCTLLIGDYNLTFEEAACLLNRAGVYLRNQALLEQAKLLQQQARALYLTLLGTDHPFTAKCLHDLAELYNDLGKYEEAEALYQQALAIREQVLGPNHLDTVHSLNSLGEFYRSRGKYQETERLYQRALTISEQMLGPEHPMVAESLVSLAKLYDDLGKYQEAEQHYQRALRTYRNAFGPEHLDVAYTLNNLAILYDNQGDFTQAELLYQQALAIREKVYGSEHPRVADSLHNLAQLYHTQGKFVQSEALFGRSLEISKRVLGPEHPEIADSLNSLALLYSDQGRYAEAEELYLQALEIRKQALGPTHRDVAACLNNLAILYGDQGNYAEAEELYLQALEIRKQALGPTHSEVADSLNNLAQFYDDQGRYAKAEELYQQVLEIRKQALGPTHLDVGDTLNNLAALYSSQGRFAQAQALYWQALELRKEALIQEQPAIASSFSTQTIPYENQDSLTQAEQLYQQALAIRQQALESEFPTKAAKLNNRALLYESQGKLLQAEQLYQQALSIRQQALGPEHADVALCMSNLAETYTDQGRYVQAEQLCLQALPILEKAVGPEHYDMTFVLLNLAEAYSFLVLQL